MVFLVPLLSDILLFEIPTEARPVLYDASLLIVLCLMVGSFPAALSKGWGCKRAH